MWGVEAFKGVSDWKNYKRSILIAKYSFLYQFLVDF